MQSHAVQNILFDLDGTLIDSSPGILAAYAEALRRERIEPLVPLAPKLIGPPMRTTVAQLVGSDDDAIIDRVALAFKHAYDTEGYRATRAYPGVGLSLRSLVDNGCRLYILTNKREAPTLSIVAMFGWSRLFAGVFALDSLSPAAPDKAALVKFVLQKHELSPEVTALVGDTPADAVAASVNGLRFVGVSWGYGSFSEPRFAGLPVLRDPANLLLCARTDA